MKYKLSHTDYIHFICPGTTNNEILESCNPMNSKNQDDIDNALDALCLVGGEHKSFLSREESVTKGILESYLNLLDMIQDNLSSYRYPIDRIGVIVISFEIAIETRISKGRDDAIDRIIGVAYYIFTRKCMELVDMSVTRLKPLFGPSSEAPSQMNLPLDYHRIQSYDGQQY